NDGCNSGFVIRTKNGGSIADDVIPLYRRFDAETWHYCVHMYSEIDRLRLFVITFEAHENVSGTISCFFLSVIFVYFDIHLIEYFEKIVCDFPFMAGF